MTDRLLQEKKRDVWQDFDLKHAVIIFFRTFSSRMRNGSRARRYSTGTAEGDGLE